MGLRRSALSLSRGGGLLSSRKLSNARQYAAWTPKKPHLGPILALTGPLSWSQYRLSGVSIFDGRGPGAGSVYSALTFQALENIG